MSSPAQDFHFIPVEGNIGAGKSTVLPKLQAALNALPCDNGKPWKVLYEEVENDPEFQRLLAAFTRDNTQRVPFQRYITERRTRICQSLDTNYNWLIERSRISDLVFCQANLMNAGCPQGNDLSYYYDIQNGFDADPTITGVIYLKTDPTVCYQRLQSRGRDAEKGTPQAYVNLISGMHDVLLPPLCEQHGIPLLVHDWTYFGCVDTLARRTLTEALNDTAASAA